MNAVVNPAQGQMRPMTPADLVQVMENELAAYEFPWTLGIFQDCLRVGYQCWLFEQGGQPLGHCVMSVAVGEAHLLNICVAPGAQGQGVGTRLLGQMLGLARRHGADTLFLEVRPSNRAALALYRKLQFHEVGCRRNYYPSGGGSGREDALILARSLTD